jgi:hypothetical protein
MPRLSSFSSRGLTGIGISLPSLQPALPSVTSFFGSTGESVTVSSDRLSLITTAQARFGTRSLQKTPVNGFGGRANSVNVPLSQTLGAPVTMEAWVWVGVGYASPNFESGPSLMLHGPAVDQATVNPTNSITFGCFGPNSFGFSSSVSVSRIPPDNTGSSANDQSNTPIPLNTWTHIALVQSDSTNFAVWVNGTRRQRNTWGAGYGLNSVMTQLTLNSDGNVGPHYIDEVRVSNIARYSVDSTTITVPADEFVSDANTVALVKFNGPKYNGSAWIEQDALGQVSIVSDSYSADGIYTALQSLSVGDTFKWSRPSPNNQQYTATLTALIDEQPGSPSFYRWLISTVPNPANNGNYPGPGDYTFFIDTIYL